MVKKVVKGRAMIQRFIGEYDFLSNFFNVPIVYEGIRYRNTEADFQAAKTVDVELRKRFKNLPAYQAKKLGRSISLREDWQQVKDQVMEDIVRYKFTKNSQMKWLLLGTGNAYLVEGNSWGDTYWGVSGGQGKNMLGLILMKIRDEIRENVGNV